MSTMPAGGERTGGKRGLENKLPLCRGGLYRGHPLHIKLTVAAGFTRKAIADWAKTKHRPRELTDFLGINAMLL